MSFGGGGFSGSRKLGLQVVSGAHGQILRFSSGSGAVVGSNDLRIGDDGSLDITGSMKIKGEVRHSGTIAPEHQTETLGTLDNKYGDVHAAKISTESVTAANLYTGDLHMKNERGDWTIFEEEKCLVVKNNITGERFKLLMEKISD